MRSDFAVDPNNPDTIYVTAPLSGVYKTVDGGLNWFNSDTGLPPAPIDIEVDPNNSLQVFAIASDAVFRSTDGGLNWFSAGSGISGQIFDVAISSTLPTTLYAGGSDGVFKSTNLGNSWVAVNTGLSAMPQTALPIAVDPTDGNRALVSQQDAMGDYQLYETTTGGSSWSVVSGPWNLTFQVSDIAFGPASTTYMVANGCLLYTSPSPRDLSTSRMPSSA